MKDHLEKADKLLREVLESAEEHEILQAILVLASEDEDEATAPEPDAAQDRQAYRKELIDKRRDQLASAIGPTLEDLKGLSLNPVGGSTGRTVLIKGQAHQIKASLALPGVRHAILDRELRLMEGE